MACNPRNPRPATVFNNANENINVYGDDVEVDYRGYEVILSMRFYSLKEILFKSQCKIKIYIYYLHYLGDSRELGEIVDRETARDNTKIQEVTD